MGFHFWLHLAQLNGISPFNRSLLTRTPQFYAMTLDHPVKLATAIKGRLHALHCHPVFVGIYVGFSITNKSGKRDAKPVSSFNGQI